MGRISDGFTSLRKRGEMGLICYLTAGYPDRARSIEYIMACLEGGADMIEVGIPFSDPVADGPVIQATSDAALRGGMRPKIVLDLVAEVRSRTEAPIVLMGYYNPIFRMGESEFTSMAAKKGADGLIVPDLPFEESLRLRRSCIRHGMDLVQLVAPTTPDDRMREIASVSSGYLYLVSRLGITGIGTSPQADLAELVGRTKACAGNMPVAAGFGISTPEQVANLHQAGSDGAIVGSGILGRMVEGVDQKAIRDYVHSLKMACR
jgi:tryptophan synthase alpha chain